MDDGFDESDEPETVTPLDALIPIADAYPLPPENGKVKIKYPAPVPLVVTVNTTVKQTMFPTFE